MSALQDKLPYYHILDLLNRTLSSMGSHNDNNNNNKAVAVHHEVRHSDVRRGSSIADINLNKNVEAR